MKEKPIVFSGAMVRAILEGRKTQTRRVVDFKRHLDDMELSEHPRGGLWYETHRVRQGERIQTGAGPFVPNDWKHYSPYGSPGDWLWLRETWAVHKQYNSLKPRELPQEAPVVYHCDIARACLERGRWRSSRFMPRWASRITLEITEVRVQRVQEISGDDALAEGVSYPGRDGMLAIAPIAKPSDDAFLRNAYAALWDSINEARGFPWSSNPWVWALTFKRVEKED